jgi:hypothetical protein
MVGWCVASGRLCKAVTTTKAAPAASAGIAGTRLCRDRSPAHEDQSGAKADNLPDTEIRPLQEYIKWICLW